jgi:hypothetical protein
MGIFELLPYAAGGKKRPSQELGLRLSRLIRQTQRGTQRRSHVEDHDTAPLVRFLAKTRQASVGADDRYPSRILANQRDGCGRKYVLFH